MPCTFSNYDILIAPSSFGECGNQPIDLLEKASLTYKNNPFGRKLMKTELLELGKSCQGILAGVEEYTEEILKNFDQLKIISRCGVGIENIDLKAAEKLGIKIKNTEKGPTDAVAELTLGLLLTLIRKIYIADADLKSGRWKKQHGNLLRGKSVGLIGFGRIGKRVAELLQPFHVSISFYDPYLDASFAPLNSVERVDSLERLLSNSDIVSIHASIKDGRSNLLGTDQLDRMKHGAFLINVARGLLVNETALHEKLLNGHIAGAALDVFQTEPYRGPLAGLENVVLTPHLGSYAKETKLEMEIDATRSIIGELKREKLNA